MTARFRTVFVAFAAVAALAAGVSGASAAAANDAPASTAQAQVITPTAAVTGFDPGNIIDDAVFFARGTMSAEAIQAFLNGKVPSCQAGYTCLKDFAMATTSRPADAMCTAPYAGQGRETAAQIIFKVSEACGINPQVLLTMLQKEQALVTHTWPSDWRYTMAMGQGCPDTAACDERYNGFFNQVYGAAWQMKRYANPPGTSQYFTWYAPGQTWNVRYHPNADCGSAPVAIRNQATANLYYYTPYQPNAAALAAGYGEGDGCSSYGNRNFHNYFTAWFGSTRSLLGTAIVDKHAALGGSGGRLGSPVGDTTCGLVVGGCYQNYQNGSIYWSVASGAYSVSGETKAAFARLDWERGPLGYPTSEDQCGLAGGACYQNFQGGLIHWSPTTGARATWGQTLGAWARADYEHGYLGYPASDNRCGLIGGGCYQDFQGGVIHWSSASGAHPTSGDVLTAWGAAGYERGVLGYPEADPQCGLKDGGCYQDFQGGLIHTSPSTGAHITWGQTGAAWAKLDYEHGVLGYPTSDDHCGLQDGGCYQDFQGGLIHWTSATGAHATYGPILQAWAALGYEHSALGYPTSDQKCGLKDGGCYQDFEGGLVHWSPSTGAHATSGKILAAWARSDYERGRFGYPTGDTVCTPGETSCTQTFQGGVLQ